MQGRNGYADVGNGLVDTVRKGESGTNEESSINIYALLGIRRRAGGSFCVTQGNSLAFCNDLEGWYGGRERDLGARGCLYNYG